MIKSCKQAGIPISPNRTEDIKLNIRGLPNITVEPWKHWILMKRLCIQWRTVLMRRPLFKDQIYIELALVHSVIRNRQGLLFTSFPGNFAYIKQMKVLYMRIELLLLESVYMIKDL